jgi:LAS superfamily LD-carboxypeptidase LdcB
MYFSIKASVLKFANTLRQASPIIIITAIPGGCILALNQRLLENNKSLNSAIQNTPHAVFHQHQIQPLHGLAFTTPQQSFSTSLALINQTIDEQLSNDRHLQSLRPEFAQQVQTLLNTLNKAGWQFTILESYRSTQRQAQLYEIGRRGVANEKIVTHAQAGQSLHEKGLAVDIAPIINGKISQNVDQPETYQAYQKLGELAAKHKLIWGGNWTLNDFGHIEYQKQP